MKKLFLLASIGLVLVVVFVLGLYEYQLRHRPTASEAKVFFTITRGQGVSSIGQALRQKQLIASAGAFDVYVWLHHLQTKLVTGDYDLPAGVSTKELADILVSGTARSQEITLQFIEGWTVTDIDAYLARQGISAPGEFLTTLKTTQFDQDLVPIIPCSVTVGCRSSAEGFLFPDTYRFYRTATLHDIAVKMVNTFDVKLSAEVRAEIVKQGRTVNEVVTLASIIEEEAKTESDRKLAAGVFLNRLKLGMALQSDVTVSYALGRPLTRADITFDSPYNTYKYKGLPPGPIANPSLSAILAAVYPTASDYYYFIAGTDGTMYWAKTIDEHEANKAKYLR